MSGIYDVTEAFDDLYEPVSVGRFPSGGYVEGKWIQDPKVDTPAEAVYHPVSKSEINKINIEGYQGRGMVKFYFKDNVSLNITNNATKTLGDMVTYKGKEYIALAKDDWTHAGGFNIYYTEAVQ